MISFHTYLDAADNSGPKSMQVRKILGAVADELGGGKVWVEKLHLVKKHSKPNPQARTGGITEKEAPIAASNVLPICPKEDKPRRVRTLLKDGKSIRVCAKCKEPF